MPPDEWLIDNQSTSKKYTKCKEKFLGPIHPPSSPHYMYVKFDECFYGEDESWIYMPNNPAASIVRHKEEDNTPIKKRRFINIYPRFQENKILTL